MPNNIKPSGGVDFWYCVYTNQVPKEVQTMFKLEEPTTLIDNAPSLLNMDAFCTDSNSAMANYITTNNIDLNGHSIPT